MQHPEESKADLCFLIPPHAPNPKDIDITLVYCNQRIICEDAGNSLRRWAKDEGLPEACIAFYHAKVGNKQKHEMEEMTHGAFETGGSSLIICEITIVATPDFRLFRRPPYENNARVCDLTRGKQCMLTQHLH